MPLKGRCAAGKTVRWTGSGPRSGCLSHNQLGATYPPVKTRCRSAAHQVFVIYAKATRMMHDCSRLGRGNLLRPFSSRVEEQKARHIMFKGQDGDRCWIDDEPVHEVERCT